MRCPDVYGNEGEVSREVALKDDSEIQQMLAGLDTWNLSKSLDVSNARTGLLTTAKAGGIGVVDLSGAALAPQITSLLCRTRHPSVTEAMCDASRTRAGTALHTDAPASSCRYRGHARSDEKPELWPPLLPAARVSMPTQRHLIRR